MLEKYQDYVMNEVLGDELIEDKKLDNMESLNDEKASIKVEKI